MNKKVLYLLVALIVLLAAGAGYLFFSLDRQVKANQEMQELAELDKKEMENEYQQFANQFQRPEKDFAQKQNQQQCPRIR